MTQKEEMQFFDAVKFDDLTSFCALVEKDETLLKSSFGRFPLLSTLYLFESKKILKMFEEKLWEENELVVLSEPFEIYKKFRQESGKSIRIYAGKNDFVMPLEMLAILHKDGKVKTAYKKHETKKVSKKKIENIYYLNGQKAVVGAKNIKISASPKSLRNAKITGISVLSVAVLVCLFFLFACFVGLGTEFFPRQIYSYNDLVSASGKSAVLNLNNDITVDGNTIENFVGTLNANNHKIIVKSENALFEKLSGTIKNATIVLEVEEISPSKNTAIVAQTNEGTIENVDLICNSKVKFSLPDAVFCGFSVKNSGKITNSTAKFDIEISSNSGNDSYFAGFVYENEGTIENCKVVESDVDAVDVDISGFVSKNSESGVVSNCESNANLSQRVSVKDWSPNVAGIVLTNYGKIENCFNFGILNVTDAVEENENSQINVGGICAINYKEIFHSKNDADIFVSSFDSGVYVGGICAQVVASETINAGIEECGASGNIEIEKQENDVFAFSGGLVGLIYGVEVANSETGFSEIYGHLKNCFTTCTLLSGFSTETNFITGLAVGLTFGKTFPFSKVFLDAQSVYCLKGDDATNAIAGCRVSNTIYIDIPLAGLEVCESLEQIETTEIFW